MTISENAQNESIRADLPPRLPRTAKAEATSTRPKLGNLYFTRAVNDLMAEDSQFAMFVVSSLTRHMGGDWGELCAEDKQANDTALQQGDLRILSAYTDKTQPKLWIITEADRSATTILFPEDY